MQEEELMNSIESFKKILKDYELELEKNPYSLFYLGLIKNTKDYIEELEEKYNELFC